MPELQSEPAPNRLRWFRSLPHPALITSAIGAALLITLIFVYARAAAPALTAPTVWGGSESAPFDPTGYGQTDLTISEGPSVATSGEARPVYLQPHADSSAGSASDSFDMAAFLSSLLEPGTRTSASSSADVSLAYSFIPRGLISTSTSKKLSPAQQALYDYGNDIGSFIQSYEETHASLPQILTDQLQDRYNEAKVAAVKGEAAAQIALGKQLADMTTVPEIARNAHRALADSYRDMGTQLSALADAKTDQALLSAIERYNGSAEAFTKRFVTLSLVFSTAGVTFETGSGGSVFSFAATGF